MIRSDIRAHAPSAVPTIKSLLKGDVIFTNFEATVIDEKKGQSRKDGRFLFPPEALEALQSFGFNLVSLSNNYSRDLKVPGIQNTLQEATHLNLAHAGTGNTLSEAARLVKIFMRPDCSIGVSRRDVLDSGCHVAHRAQAEQGRGRAAGCSCLGGCVLRDNALGTG